MLTCLVSSGAWLLSVPLVQAVKLQSQVTIKPAHLSSGQATVTGGIAACSPVWCLAVHACCLYLLAQTVKRQSQVTINHAHLSGVQRNVIQVLAIIRLLPLFVLGALLVHAVQSSHTYQASLTPHWTSVPETVGVIKLQARAGQ